MATHLQNLSNYDVNSLPSSIVLSTQRYAIAVADWNAPITHTLLKGALDTLIQQGVSSDNISVLHVPGAVELTYAAKVLQSAVPMPQAVIVIGCVIKGDTPHFDYVCDSVTVGVTELNLKQGACPVVFGVLTTDDLQQAQDRAGGIHGNKGVEAAITAIKMANIFW